MRYFDLRGLLPQAQTPSSEALATFDRVGTWEDVMAGERVEGTLTEVIGRLETAGVGADRHTSPDLLGQLRAAARGRVDTVVCSLLDGDATLRLNAALGARYPEELMTGLDFLDKLVVARRSWVVTDETAPPNWLVPVRGAARLTRRRLVSLRNDYPESDPTLLLFTLLKRKLKPGRLPTEVNAIVLDAAAAIELGRFARTGAGMRHSWVAVHHPEWAATRYADVASGTPLSDILDHMGLKGADFVVRAGDLLRDRKVANDLPVRNGELTFHVNHPEHATNADPCVRCGWCTEGCPVRIHPAGLLEAAQQNNALLGRHYGLESCIECGICAYVCPSHLPILAGIRALRAGGGR